ncbi:esterase-related protein, carbohydrate esterase family 1 protein [Cytophaga hutchinsonii ATCC 33406]|uniref:Esterase-related protein, carbohydrate esterase family 1 protein n=2 Tax=Cytophaga hutchinsonii TaxID=985 RepID=A0A6N4STX2_CYTH3|nr:esterase-related protein, carbohydrate esterase family 1 protein [Cytophaga hutchinsonii ATCC 33406]
MIMWRKFEGMKTVQLICIKMSCIMLFFVSGYAKGTQEEHTMQFGEEKTTYLLHLPKGYIQGKAYSLVVNFHGLGSAAIKHQHYCQLDAVADKEGFIAVYPQSYHQGWNAGLGFTSYIQGHDDIAYFNALLDTLEAAYSIDKNRIYVTGVSLGGSFTYRIACEMSKRIAAIASVSGLMSDSTLIYCTPERSVPVMHIHGTKDHIMRYTGMKQAFGAEEVVRLWALKDQCENKPDTVFVPNTSKKDHTSSILIKYTHCANGSEVWFYKIYNGGHTWPGAAKAFKLMGRKSKDFNGSQAIWDFFETFTLQTGVSMQTRK